MTLLTTSAITHMAQNRVGIRNNVNMIKSINLLSTTTLNSFNLVNLNRDLIKLQSSSISGLRLIDLIVHISATWSCSTKRSSLRPPLMRTFDCQPTQGFLSHSTLSSLGEQTSPMQTETLLSGSSRGTLAN